MKKYNKVISIILLVCVLITTYASAVPVSAENKIVENAVYENPTVFIDEEKVQDEEIREFIPFLEEKKAVEVEERNNTVFAASPSSSASISGYCGGTLSGKLSTVAYLPEFETEERDIDNDVPVDFEKPFNFNKYNYNSSVRWSLSNGVLTVSGNGYMADFGDFVFSYDYIKYDPTGKKPEKTIPIRNQKATLYAPWYEYGKAGEITAIVIGSGVKHIGNNAFYFGGNNSSVTSITLADSIETIGDGAFQALNQATVSSNSLPSSLTTIGQYAFNNCRKLNISTLPIKLKTINEKAFQNTQCTIKVIPESVTYIGGGAFKGVSASYMPYLIIKNPNMTMGTVSEKLQSSVGTFIDVYSPFPNVTDFYGTFDTGAFLNNLKSLDVKDYQKKYYTLPLMSLSASVRQGYESTVYDEGKNYNTSHYVVKAVFKSGFSVSKNKDKSIAVTNDNTQFIDYSSSEGKYRQYNLIGHKELKAGQTSVTAQYTFDGVTKSVDMPITIKAKEVPPPPSPPPAPPEPVWVSADAAWNIGKVNPTDVVAKYYKNSDGETGKLYIYNTKNYNAEMKDWTSPESVPWYAYKVSNIYFGGYNSSDNTAVRGSGFITNIGDYAFYNYKNSLTGSFSEIINIGDYAFYNSSVNPMFGDKVTDIGDYAFYGCTSLSPNIEQSTCLYFSKEWHFVNGNITSNFGNSKISNIGSYAFYGCKSFAGLAGDFVSIVGTQLSVPVSKNFYNSSRISSWNNFADDVVIGDYAFAHTGDILYSSGLVKEVPYDSLIINGDKASFPPEMFEELSFFIYNAHKTYLKANSVKIGKNAFEGVTHFTQINCQSVKNLSGEDIIASGAFRDCTDLKYFDAQNYITEIGNYAFYGCGNLLTVNSNFAYLTNIGSYAFYNCESMENIRPLTEPYGLASIGSYAFYNCVGLNGAISLYNKPITSIGAYAFKDCKNLNILSLPDSLTVINTQTFYNCESMTLSQLPARLTRISYGAFYNCRNIALTKLPETLQIIGSTTANPASFYVQTGAFSGCEKIKITEIPASCTTVSAGTFNGCSSIEYLIFRNKDTAVGVSSLDGFLTLPLETIVFSKGDDSSAVGTFARNNGNVYAQIPLVSISVSSTAGITSFYVGGFLDINTLEASATFTNGTVLTLNGADDNFKTFYLSDNGGIAYSDDDKLYAHYTFDGVTKSGGIPVSEWKWRLGFNDGADIIAFLDCASNKLSVIGQGDMRNLTESSSLPSRIALCEMSDEITSIGDYVFYNCRNMLLSALPPALRSIGAYAFYNCSKVTFNRIPHTVTDIGAYALYGCNQPYFIFGTLANKERITYIGTNAIPKTAYLYGYLPNASSRLYAYNGAMYYQLPVLSLTSTKPTVAYGYGDYFNTNDVTVTVIYSNGKTNILNYGNNDWLSYTLPRAYGLRMIGYNDNLMHRLSVQYTFDGATVECVIPIRKWRIGGANNGSGVIFELNDNTGEAVISVTGSAAQKITKIAGDNANTYWNALKSNITRIHFDSSCNLLSEIDCAAYYSEGLFSGCSNLTQVSFGNNCGLKNIGYMMFGDCSKLKIISLPENIERIDAYAFKNCLSFTGNDEKKLILGSKTASIGESAFYNCPLIEKLIWENTSNINIGNKAFYNCTRLNYIVIKAKAASVGTNAFYETAKTLTTLYYDYRNTAVSAYNWSGDNRIFDTFACLTDIALIVSLNNTFSINPNNKNSFVSNNPITILNKSYYPVKATAQKIQAQGNAPKVVSRDGRDWDNIGAFETRNNIALGYKDIRGGSTGTTSPDFFFQNESVDTNRELFTLKNGETGSMVLQGISGRAWKRAETISYSSIFCFAVTVS